MLVDGQAEYSLLQKTRSKKFRQETILLESDFEEDDSDIFLATSNTRNCHEPSHQKSLEIGTDPERETVATYLKPGVIFGKVPFFTSPSKSDTKIVRCATDCKVVVLTGLNFRRVCKEVTRRFLNSEVNFFRSLPLLRSLRKGSLSKIATQLQLKTVIKGSTLFRED